MRHPLKKIPVENIITQRAAFSFYQSEHDDQPCTRGVLLILQHIFLDGTTAHWVGVRPRGGREEGDERIFPDRSFMFCFKMLIVETNTRKKKIR